MVVILAVLVTLFAAYSTMHYLEDAVYGLMPGSTVMSLILLKIFISLEVLLPSTLYLSVIVGIGRLYKDGEMTALFTSGIGFTRVLMVVFALSLLVAIMVAGLSLFARPWAYKTGYRLKAKAMADFDVTRLQAGRFYKIGGKNRVIFITRINHKQKKATGVFIQQNKKNNNDMLEVIYAEKARQNLSRFGGRQDILFSNGYIYEFYHTGEGDWKITKFDQLTFTLWPREITPVENKIKAASTMHLARSHTPSGIAELQWRFSTSLSTILLALLGVPLSRTTPRKGKYAKVIMAMLIYSFYYIISSMAKILVIQGHIPTLPGIWWVQGVLAGLLFILLLHPSQQFQP